MCDVQFADGVKLNELRGRLGLNETFIASVTKV